MRKTYHKPKRRLSVTAIHEALEARFLLSATPPGSYDPSFGVNGVSNLDPAITPGGQADAVAIQTNGDIVVAGYQYPMLGNTKSVEEVVLLRYLPNGDLDTTFGSGGKVLNTDAQLANAVAVEPDGDIVVAGRSNGDFYAARYTSSGQLDPTFGRNGEVKFDLGARDTVQAMAITSDGKITLAGSTTAGAGGDFAVARLNANGSIDTTFGNGGKTFIDFNGKADGANDVEFLNNKIYLAGFATTAAGNTDFALARLNLNGSLDTSYGTGGKVTTDINGDENAQILRMAIKSDGTVTVVGYSSASNNDLQNSSLAQYTPSGHLDGSFGSGGTVVVNLATPPGNIESQQLTGIAYRSNGSIVVSGWVFDPTYNYEPTQHQYEWTAANFSASGALLNQNAIGFQFGGKNFAYNMTLDSTGHAVLVGQRQATNLEFGVARLNTDLALDTSFGRVETSYLPYAGVPNPQDGGAANTSFGAVWGNPIGVTGATIASVVQPDGKVILGGYNSQSTSAIIRLNTDGSLDTSFNVSTTVQLNGDGGPVLLLQPDGKLLAVNFGNIARLNSDGSLDTTFGTNGFYTPASGRVNGVALGPDGTIYVAGDTQYDTGIGSANFVLYRLTSSGALDPTFGNDGASQIVTAQPQQELVTAITVQPDGKIVLAGQTLYTQTGGGLITRFNSDGTLDTTFGTNGFYTYQSDAEVTQLAMQGNDVLFAGEVLPTSSAYYQLYLGRLTPLGQLDTTFGSDGVVPQPAPEGDTGILIATDGSIYVSAQLQAFAPTSGLFHYTANGALDTTFGNNGFATAALPVDYVSATVSSIALAPNNELVESLNLYPELSYNNAYGAARIQLGSIVTTSTALTGTVIGTAGSYQNDGNTISKAFDGILTNYFDGPTANGDYAGLDLGTPKVITQIGYDPRTGFNGRMIGGIFQGSNSANFAGATTLYTITNSPPSATLTLVNISNSNAFRYVRYFAPNGSWGDVGELAFYGTAPTTPTMVTGTTIGTSGSYRNQGNTLANVFDGSLSTFFDAPAASNDWVGLDLGSAQVVTQVNYAPRAGWESRMVGGMIQASNTADFSSGVVTLYTIGSTPTAGVLTTAPITNATAYRYYRYVGPANSYCNIAELELFV